MIAKFRYALLVAALGLTALALAACGGDDAPPATPANGGQATPANGPATVVHVELSEWAVAPDPESAPAGSVTFEATNAGGLRHDLVVIRTDLDHGELPASGGSVDLNADGLEVAGRIAEFPRGQSASESLTLASGHYALICSVPGHYSAGMHTAFTVE